MDRFKLSINVIENRWTNLFLLINEHEIMLYFENVPNDPLYSLLESAITITRKAESSIIFSNHSQRTYLSVKKLENSFCRIEINTVYIDLPVKQFCKVILRMFDSYTFDFSKEEYSDNWNTFPETELEKLRVLYHTL